MSPSGVVFVRSLFYSFLFLSPQTLLRKLKNEYPHICELKDLKESYYKQLEGVFEKWKVSLMIVYINEKKTVMCQMSKVIWCYGE